jgi:membrane protease YdiL (CAAX protease family)
MALDADAARTLAETRARDDWQVDLSRYKLIEHSQETQKSGRVDHAFVYERPEQLGEATVRLRLVVAGDELIGVGSYLKIPERFQRRYQELRSANNLIAGIASVAALLLYGIGGVVVGSLWLSRRHWLLWRPALTAGACVSVLLALSLLANAGSSWFSADTTETVTTFWAKRAGTAVLLVVFGALAYGVVFMAAESLSRRAFPHMPQLWRVFAREEGSSRQVLGRALGGYLFVPIELALIALFYYATNRWLGWWQPSEVLTDPNILGSAVPALSPIALSLQAGFMEECAFRAIPLSLGALIGAHYRHRTLGIVLALILQAIVFGCAHANYPGFPAYSRPVELFGPSIVWGLIFLRFGLVPTVLLHATFDLTLFAIPVFLLDAPGALAQQALIVAAGLVPLAIVGWRVARAGGLHELPVGAWNGAWQPVVPEPEHARAAAAEAVHTRYAAAFQRALPILGLAGLVAWAALAPFRADVPAPRVDRAVAIAAAEKALAARGVHLGSEWEHLANVRVASDDPRQWVQHRFVWQEAGPKQYHALIGHVLAPPTWDVRFARFGGDIGERAEEWRVSVGTLGDVRTQRHTLPEGRPGASLTRDAAQAIAEREVRARFDLDPSALRLVGAEETKRPARVDWTFTWGDPRLEVGKDGEARYVVALAGDELAAYGRYVFVPEAWRRAEEERQNRAQVATIGAALVFIAAGLAALIVGVRAWTRHRTDVRALWITFVLSAIATLLMAANSVPAFAFDLRTAEPLWSQWLMRILGAVAAALVGALVLALVGGVGSWAARTAPRRALSSRLPLWGAAVCAALLQLGVQTALASLAPRSAPIWPALTLGQWSPAFGGLLAGLNFVPLAGASLFIVYLVARLTHGFTRHAWIGVAIIVLLESAAALVQAGGQYTGALVAGVTGGLTASAVLWWVLRYDLRMLPAYVATGAIATAFTRAFQTATPQGWTVFAIAALATVAMAWLVTRYIDRPLEATASSPIAG